MRRRAQLRSLFCVIMCARVFAAALSGPCANPCASVLTVLSAHASAHVSGKPTCLVMRQDGRFRAPSGSATPVIRCTHTQTTFPLWLNPRRSFAAFWRCPSSCSTPHFTAAIHQRIPTTHPHPTSHQHVPTARSTPLSTTAVHQRAPATRPQPTPHQ